MEKIIPYFGFTFDFIGRKAISTFVYVTDLITFIVKMLSIWVRGGHLFNPASKRNVISQIIFTGIDAFQSITIIALFLGTVICSQIIIFLQRYLEPEPLATILIKVVGLELGTIVSAIMIIGRSASAISVELGNMKLHKELYSFENLGINIADFIIAPRIIATTLTQLALASYFAMFALFGGIAMTTLFFSSNISNLFGYVLTGFTLPGILLFVAKNIVLGALIGGVACFQALSVVDSPTEVPQRTQRAIVHCQLLVFITNAIVAFATFILIS